MSRQRVVSKRAKAKALGYRSGLERDFHALNPELKYEPGAFEYLVQETRKYYPDFVSQCGKIWYETKGLFDAADRKKMKMVKDQYPEIRIILVFQDSRRTLGKSKKSKTYAEWASRYGFEYLCLMELKRNEKDKYL
jgi:hypothetical protein